MGEKLILAVTVLIYWKYLEVVEELFQLNSLWSFIVAGLIFLVVTQKIKKFFEEVLK